MPRKRLRQWGLQVGEMQPGSYNNITDVPGVRVGHVTVTSGDGSSDVRTGVTCILPHGRDLFREKVVAASHVINGFGKTTGLVQVNELGALEAPILLTNTFSVPAVTQGTMEYMLGEDSEIGDSAGSLNVVVGECNDSYLNDMRGMHVQPHHAVEAIHKARAMTSPGPIEEGAVGAGTGMVCFGWKGGIGSASRKIVLDNDVYHLGMLVLTNFGVAADLTILGQPVGKSGLSSQTNLPEPQSGASHSLNHTQTATDGSGSSSINSDGSIILVMATDLPLDSRQLQRLAKRAAFGLARVGSIAHHGSGDIVIAFSTANKIPHRHVQHNHLVQVLAEDGPAISQSFRAVVEVAEEAILNSLFMADTTVGKRGRVIEGVPVERLIKST